MFANVNLYEDGLVRAENIFSENESAFFTFHFSPLASHLCTNQKKISLLIEIKIPVVGESINEVTLAKWLKNDGDLVQRDEMICEMESEKATFELNAEQAGKLKIIATEKSVLKIGDVVATIDTSFSSSEKNPEQKKTSIKKSKEEKPKEVSEIKTEPQPEKIPEPKPEAQTGREEKREPMSTLRKAVSKHLVAAKNQTAMLTTFNEVDMKAILDIRAQSKELFKEKYGVGLGFMSFFMKAVCRAIKEFPAVNASIDGDEIIYHDYIDISIAVSTPKGLVVPVIRNAETLSMAEIEMKVADLANRGRENKLTMDEMSGGTFTISNGGVFGSLMSTPIINIPQVAILGMHKIQERPVAINGEIVIRPMMYLALSYDHRMIDGKESVTFLVRVKEQLENPMQLLTT